MSHIDPATGTNPFFEGVGYTPGHQFVDRDLGPEQPVAAVEELLATAIVDLPDVLSQGCDAEAYLNKRGFATLPVPTAETGAKEHLRGGSNSSSPSSDAIHLYYDAVIVGSGAGGGVSAALLSSAGIRVLVLEKASWVRSKDMSWLEGEAHAEMYERAGFLTTHDAGVSILAGATLGGGTKINWTASLKTPDHVRQEWASAPHHLTHLGPDSPAYDAALNTVCGRLSVSTDTHMSAPNAKLLEGCQKLGFHAEQLPRNCLSKKCSAYCNFGCRSGHKQSSDVCWLTDAVRAGAHVLTGVEGRRVILKKQATGSKRKKVAGLVAVSSCRSRPAAPDNTLQQCTVIIHAPMVVSSCGSIHTPALLLRSGVRVGGNVGRHLRLHPAAGMVGMFKQQAAAQEQAAAARGSIQMYQGVSMGAFSRDAANWTAGGYGAMVSVPAAHPGLLAVVSPDSQPGALKELLTHLPDVSCCVIFTRDSSSGRVEVDKEGQPVIKYWPCNQTLQHLLDGISLAARSLVAAGAVRILLPNFLHDWQLKLNPNAPLPVRMAQLEDFLVRVRQDGVVKYSMPLLSAHQMGSCRMGSSPRISVVDPTGECWNVSGLYVADASLFPTASGVNPMITVYALSYLVASGIAQRWKVAQKALKAGKTEAMDTDSIRDQAMAK